MTPFPKCLAIGGPRHGEVIPWDMDRMEVAIMDRWPLYVWKDVCPMEEHVGRRFCYRRVRIMAPPDGSERWALIPNAVPMSHEIAFVLAAVFDMAAGRPLVMGEG